MEQSTPRHMDLKDLQRVPTVLPMLEDVDHLVRDALRLVSPSGADISSGVSHCIRTPLTTLLGIEEIVQKGLPMTEPERESFLRTVLFESARLRRFVEMLTWFDEMERGSFVLQPSRTDIRRTFARAMKSFDPDEWSKRVRIVVEPMSHAMVLTADHDRLKHAFEQLLLNALHVSPPDGEVRIRFKDAAESVEICISNDGPAIPAEDRDRIFDAFERIPHANDTGGELGIGLTIVRRIARQHDGSIRCLPGSLSGMSFVVSLPK